MSYASALGAAKALEPDVGEFPHPQYRYRSRLGPPCLDLIRPLSDITLADIESVGGKAAHLGAMMRAGFPVPPGFVITVDAFTDHFGPTTEPLVKPATPRLQPEFMAAVVEAVREHLGDESTLAVRSSSTSEDSNEASFAGQHATYYFVPPIRIDQAILDCWMSLWSEAALSYRRSGVTEITSGEPVRMAVIVQQMVNATRSGVAFSTDPIDLTNNDCVIEAIWGLGAALVDGRVSPDKIRVTDAGAVSYDISTKEHFVTPNPSNPDGKRLEEVPRHQANAAVVSDEEAEHLASVTRQLETLFEGPQDVEWAFDGEDLKVLQSRPITTLDQELPTDKRLALFKPLAENFTEPLTPMSADLYARILPNFGEIVAGRFYIDLDRLRAIVPFELSDAELVDLALLRRMPEAPALSWPLAAKSALFGILTFLVDGATWLRAGWLQESGLAKYKRLADSISDNPKVDPPRALRRLFLGHHPFEPLGHHMVMVNITAGRYFFFLGMLKAVVKRFAPGYAEAELNKTFHGRQQMHSVELVEEVERLAALLAECRNEADEGMERVEAVIAGEETLLPPGHNFTTAVEGFLERFGHRGSREMELAAPRWRESVQPLLAMIASHEPKHAESVDPVHGSHLAALDALHQELRPWQRRIVDWLIERVAKFTALRENTRHFHIMGFDVTRQKLLAMEQELLFNDHLAAPGDIFFLRFSEATALTNGELDPPDARQLVRQRRRQWARQSRLPIAETLNVAALHERSEDALLGQCASPGSVEGIARVVRSLREADTLNAGEILIAPYTDPSWTPLFPRAAGIVVAMGSYLSHAGTLARELHVPCVVDVANCTELIESGQRIRLDADAGSIEVVS